MWTPFGVYYTKGTLLSMSGLVFGWTPGHGAPLIAKVPGGLRKPFP